MSVSIRAGSSDDAEALTSIFREAVTSVSGSDYSSEEIAAWIDAVSVESMRTGLRARDATTIVAEDATPVGFATRQDCRVKAVYVHPEEQGRGIGSTLLSRVESTARRREIHTLCVSASLNAVSFYAAHGYERRGPDRMELGDQGEIRCVRMKKAVVNDPAPS